MQKSSQAFNGIAVQSTVTILLSVIELTYFSLMSRLLTQSVFGELAIIMAVVAIMQSLSDAGLGSALIQSQETEKSFKSTALSLSLVLGIFFTILLFCTSSLFSRLLVKSDLLTQAFQLISFTFLLQAFYNIYRSQLIKELKFKVCGLISVGAALISCSVGVYLAYLGYGVYSILIATITNQVLLMIMFYIYKSEHVGLKVERKFIKSIMSYGGWLTGAVLVRSFTNQVDKMIIARWLPLSDLGALNRPSGFITKITGTINGIFDTVLFPILSSIQNDLQKAKEAYLKLSNLILLLSSWMTIGFIVSTNIIILIFFGDQWLYLKPIFIVITISVLFLGYSQIGDCFFRSLGIVKSYFLLRVAVFAVTMISVYIGCQSGILAVTIGITLSRIFDAVIKFFILKKKLELSSKEIFTSFGSTIFPSAIVFAVAIGASLINEYISLSIIIISFIYMGFFKPSLLGRDYRLTVYPHLVERFKKNR